jgi:hypothetical protein
VHFGGDFGEAFRVLELLDLIVSLLEHLHEVRDVVGEGLLDLLVEFLSLLSCL